MLRHVNSNPHALQSLRPWRYILGPKKSVPQIWKGLFALVTRKEGKLLQICHTGFALCNAHSPQSAI